MSDLLRHQIDYYRARAAEYDEWFYRLGRYDQGEAHTRQWRLETERVRARLHSGQKQGHILELAPGTGIWTRELIELGDRVTALDASPEMIAINRAKLGSSRVDYRLTDLFAWQPAARYDMVFFGFWLSHVPADKLGAFLDKVRTALKPGGRLFLVDSRRAESATSSDQSVATVDDRQERFLNDGRRFEIVKIYYDPAALTETLQAHGFDIEARTTENFFLYADGVKRR